MSPAALAESLSLALISGTADDVPAAREALRLANHQKTVMRDADALTSFRSEDKPWAWPTSAPWSGF